MSFPQDPTLSDVHVVIVVTDGKYVLEDQATEAGVLFQSDLERAIELDRGAVIRAGRQWLVVGDRKRANTVVHYNESGQRLAQFELKDGTTVVANTGTYIDSPFHRFADGKDISELERVRFVMKDGVVYKGAAPAPLP